MLWEQKAIYNLPINMGAKLKDDDTIFITNDQYSGVKDADTAFISKDQYSGVKDADTAFITKDQYSGVKGKIH